MSIKTSFLISLENPFSLKPILGTWHLYIKTTLPIQSAFCLPWAVFISRVLSLHFILFFLNHRIRWWYHFSQRDPEANLSRPRPLGQQAAEQSTQETRQHAPLIGKEDLIGKKWNWNTWASPGYAVFIWPIYYQVLWSPEHELISDLSVYFIFGLM